MLIVSDNGTQFNSAPMEAFLAEHNVRFYNSAPHYPESNGQAESSNKTVVVGIKRRLTTKKGSRWKYCITSSGLTVEPPSVHRTEALLFSFWDGRCDSHSVTMAANRIHDFHPSRNEDAIKLNHDMAEEKRSSKDLDCCLLERGC